MDGEQADEISMDPDAHRDRVLQRARETVARLDRTRREDEVYRNDPQREERSRAADEYMREAAERQRLALLEADKRAMHYQVPRSGKDDKRLATQAFVNDAIINAAKLIGAECGRVDRGYERRIAELEREIRELKAAPARKSRRDALREGVG